MADSRLANDPMDPWTIEFTRRSYDETGSKGAEPRKRWLNLVSRSPRSKWHIRVTFQDTLRSTQRTAIFAKRTKRRNDLENLCLCVDFERMSLLRDTVTELVVTRDHNAQHIRLPLRRQPDLDSEYAPVADHLWVSIREDPLRVQFPLYTGSGGTLTKELSTITKGQDLGTGVYEARVDGDEGLYVYKEVDRLLYVPSDSEVLEQELRNLEILRGMEAIARLVAAGVYENPYQATETDEDDTPTVLRGILLEDHPNGTLKDALQSPRPNMDGRWREWGLQITGALSCLHQNGITHMDMKPSNVVISAEWNAILIDVSGIGGVTREWLSPEMRDIDNPLSQGMEARKQNDIWALGKMLSAMADVITI